MSTTYSEWEDLSDDEQWESFQNAVSAMESLQKKNAAFLSRMEKLESALREVHGDATRCKRASDIKKYLLGDLERIENTATEALKP